MDLHFKLLTAHEVALLHAMHVTCFDMPWRQEAFESLLTLPTTLVLGAFLDIHKLGSAPHQIELDYPPHPSAVNKNISSQDFSEIFVGFMMLSILSGAEAEILTFCVHPKYQQLGIGRQLMDELLSSLTIFHCTRCYLDVAENNTSAIKLYENFGFKVTGKRQNYYIDSKGETLSALLMTFDVEK